MKIAFIGLGNMGIGLVRDLIRSGHALTVYNRTRSRSEQLQAMGAQVAETADQELPKTSDAYQWQIVTIQEAERPFF
jgi:3-hydroxyisobutyrate dehydrogenase-like beta-hydroxyacid dehydrogenase